MRERIVDLSHRIEPSSINPYTDPYEAMTSIVAHATVQKHGYYECHIFMSEHTCTHIESNLHWNTKGRPIERMPLNLMYCEAAKLDFTHIDSGEEISKTKLKRAAREAKIDLRNQKIILLATNFYKAWGTEKYVDLQPNLLPGAAEWLISLGVKIIGVDALVPEVNRSKLNPKIDFRDMNRCWPLHALFNSYDFYLVERMANLDRVPAKFKLMMMPLKFAKACASPVRALAVLSD